ncbi:MULTISPECIES: aminotransferase class I/II-fold pyridoxal phosphate-dependent enzyme [Acidobacteriaceae]|uniref:pyridoxal phosphate-dependent decarboxylase family protein n=1 Tax=Acidobacteriaceae TaxID=204434 RepID=UPI00131B187A|nr:MULTISPECIES: aminotransferase class I/II-fold pyridoxal phosphate-dependent enzyme [Acidobacteriaceae]MDW5267395.1 aminotransferase class I/II-fold pyridoxal phosphate-dependent enzyme [Edaphobacter sp.]
MADEPLGDFFQHLAEAQRRLDDSSAHLPASPAPPLDEAAAAILNQVATRLHDNYPYAHPLYAGQMLKPPHPIARAAYTLAMAVNPNNHALDGGRASSAMEIEAVAAIAKMFGWPQHLGHLTSGGTFANLEALWIAGQLAPGKSIAASDQAHYTHSRISAVLGLPFVKIPSDNTGCIDLHALEALLETQTIGTVVVTLGTTAIGSIDPLDEILKLRERHNFRIHLDAAYGGYFTLAANLSTETRAAYAAIAQADSIVIDPHKHGLQPYGCGCILFRDPTVGRFYKHDSPYTYFSSKDLHLGEISLECSRAGASAVALWATQQLLPYIPGGTFAQNLEASHQAALELHRFLGVSPHFVTPAFAPALDIVFWTAKSPTLELSSALAQKIFDEAARQDLHLALATLPTRFFPPATWPQAEQSGNVTCLRSVLMKPEHLAWIDEIWKRLVASVTAVATVNTTPVPR